MEELLSRQLSEHEKISLPVGLIQFREELLERRRKTEQERLDNLKPTVAPFHRKIDDFAITAIVLQFVGYQDEICELMNRLSKSTRRYYKRELEGSLKDNLQEWSP